MSDRNPQNSSDIAAPSRLVVWLVKIPFLLGFGLTILIPSTIGTSAHGADDPLDFNRDIRPILSENCFYCHGQDANKRHADLRLDDQSAAIESGAVVPHDSEKSEIMVRVHSDDPETLMPPPDSNRRLTDQQKAILKRWINEGARYSPHWAFVNPTRPELPTVSQSEWVRNPIDQFVLEKLDSLGLKPSPEAERSTLIKRLYADLLGLPPSIEEVRAFIDDPAPDAYERLVDNLLSNKHYGERMALPWLDAARYADSNGFQQDGDTWQWIWRDWVVKAMNDDMPFDDFTTWQLAGDLLPNATVEQKIATGFNRNHLQNGEGGAIAEEQRFVTLFDRVDTTATTWLGLTIACAQCHDHKYDPITQRDYYSLMDAFNRVPETGTPARLSPRIRLGKPYLELPTEENLAKIAKLDEGVRVVEAEAKPTQEAIFAGWKIGLLSDGNGADGQELPESVKKLLNKPEADRTDEEKKKLDDELRTHFFNKVQTTLGSKFPVLANLEKLTKDRSSYKGDQIPRPMIMSDDQPRATHILDRGEYLKPTDKVAFETPSFLPPMSDDAPRNRLGLAQWLVSQDNPLTARVQVNKMWQHFFGIGIIKTAEDFGVQSEYPLHGKLLDWLASEFRESGWKMKAMNRLIVTSSTYRQSSRLSPELLTRDPENRLYARASRFRMPSMILRDWALSVASIIQDSIGGAPVYPYQPDDVWEALAITKERDFTYPISSGSDLYRRSLYTFWRRTVSPANMFDTANRQTCRVRQGNTSTPLHALTTLNDPTWVEAARVLAEKLMQSQNQDDDRMRLAFAKVTCREASDKEVRQLQRIFDYQLGYYQGSVEQAKRLLATGSSPRDESIDAAKHAAMTIVCLAILNLDEAMTRE
ncbi:MAG: PSD1 and planctomycete cytochrome C domain-containing protein [Planctomycetota bacterium]|nr:PSD1 and planctomycete cytochrome C domain-containing protein [Planctomycetota bacterium]